MSNSPKTFQCANCGVVLPEHAPAGLCPKCLLAAGLNTQQGPEGTVVLPQSAIAARRGLPQPGEQFGHYQLVRLLGQGGMGVVYEAEDLESGRRVALKILGQALDSPDSRKRFLREGQLAASINHPNSVYVYGTEEIAGTPVISMELVAGGTLRDRVIAAGPMASTEAVECILQIIAGLEAAQRIGILHRDVKPSNCFIDSDGVAKIGDFGLSITTAVRTESNITQTGALFGTPAFSSPEQLRGEELTARSDIYAVGVTLFYLLTGRTPFEAPNVVQLLATVLERRPESPAKFRADIPRGLCQAVLRCLEKDAGQRFPDYAALREALLPYAPGSPTPATLGLRFLAGCIDSAIITVPLMLLTFVFCGGLETMGAPGLTAKQALSASVGYLVVLLYYGLLEGLRGATPGKALCRLRVVRSDRNPPGVWTAMLRAMVFFGLPAIPHIILSLNTHWGLQNTSSLKFSLVALIGTAMQILMFATMRRSNGFASIHDLLTKTRVIVRSRASQRPMLAAQPETPPKIEGTPQKGPYFVLDSLGASGSAELFLGYDARLLRKVWIRTRPAGVPPISPGLRNVSRPGRLRWINGSRLAEESWDAYEELTGQALTKLIGEKKGWDSVRFWLLDLAEELAAVRRLGEPMPLLSLDRVWITAEGRAKLLDFPAPNAGSVFDATTLPATEIEFLRQVALSALEGRVVGLDAARRETPGVPLSMHARGFIDRLTKPISLPEIVTQLRPLLEKLSTVTRLRRVGMLAFMMCFPLLTMGVMWISTSYSGDFTRTTHQVVDLQRCLIQLKTLESGTNPAERKNLEIYVVGRFRQQITNATEWNGTWARSLIPAPERAVAERLIANRPQPAPAEFAEAKKAVEKQLSITTETAPPPTAPVSDRSRWMKWVIGYGCTIGYAVVPSLLAALFFRGGLVLRGFGVAVVNRRGVESRWRVFWRALLAWLPFLLLPIPVHLFERTLGQIGAVYLSLGLLAMATGLSLLMKRSFQDRLAGTYLVARAPAPELAVVSGTKGLLRLLVLLIIVGALGAYVIPRHNAPVPKPLSVPVASGPATEHFVVQPDGSPAGGAQIWICSGTLGGTLHCSGAGNYYFRGAQNEKTQAGPDGKFMLPAAGADRVVVCANSNGLVTAAYSQVAKTHVIKLQPWGRVEGVLMSEGKPKADANISLSTVDFTSGVDINYSEVSKADGSFVFTNIPAGEYLLSRYFPPRDNYEVMASRRLTVTNNFLSLNQGKLSN